MKTKREFQVNRKEYLTTYSNSVGIFLFWNYFLGFTYKLHELLLLFVNDWSYLSESVKFTQIEVNKMILFNKKQLVSLVWDTLSQIQHEIWEIWQIWKKKLEIWEHSGQQFLRVFFGEKKITFVFFFIFECTTSKFMFQKEATEMKLNTIIFVHCLKNVKTLWLFRLTKARDNIEI